MCFNLTWPTRQINEGKQKMLPAFVLHKDSWRKVFHNEWRRDCEELNGGKMPTLLNIAIKQSRDPDDFLFSI